MIAQQFALIRRNEIKRMLVLRQPCFDGNYLYHEEHEAPKELLNKAFKSLLQQPYSFNTSCPSCSLWLDRNHQYKVVGALGACPARERWLWSIPSSTVCQLRKLQPNVHGCIYRVSWSLRPRPSSFKKGIVTFRFSLSDALSTVSRRENNAPVSLDT